MFTCGENGRDKRTTSPVHEETRRKKSSIASCPKHDISETSLSTLSQNYLVARTLLIT
jgi:hypothetical protein